MDTCSFLYAEGFNQVKDVHTILLIVIIIFSSTSSLTMQVEFNETSIVYTLCWSGLGATCHDSMAGCEVIE